MTSMDTLVQVFFQIAYDRQRKAGFGRSDAWLNAVADLAGIRRAG